MIENVNPIWVVWTNTDLTEGRGANYVLYWCETETTANRLAKGRGVMGSDADVLIHKTYLIDRVLYIPASRMNLIKPSKEDIAEDQKNCSNRKSKISGSNGRRYCYSHENRLTCC